MAKAALGIDIGSSSIKVVEGRDRKGSFEVLRLLEIPLEGSTATPAQVGELLAEALKRAGIKQRHAVVGLSGRDLMMRYSQVPPTPEWQLRDLMDFEIQEIRQQSGEDLAADFNLLAVGSEYSGDDTVLLALAKEGLVARLKESLEAAGLRARFFTPSSVALYNAFAKAGPETSGITMLASIGAQNSDIAILRDSELIFARNISTGGAVFNEALVSQFNVSQAKAERLKLEMGNASPREARRGMSPQEEKVARALEAGAGQIFSMIRSTVMFCKTQLKLQELALEHVYVCGGTAKLTGLVDSLAANLGVPVEPFNGFANLLAPALEEEAEAHGLAATPALGLAMTGVYSDLYSLEILPPAERKRREFQRTHLYSLLAILAVLAYLAFDAVSSRSEHLSLRSDVKRLGSEVTKITSDQRRCDALVKERDLLADTISKLEAYREATLGLPAVLRAAQKCLPPELWIHKIEIEEAPPPDAPQGGKRPAIVIEGKGRELERGSLKDVFLRFDAALRSEPGIAGTLPLASAGTPFEFRVTVYPARFHAAASGESPEGERDQAGPSEATPPAPSR
ncbi:MAG: pilus assembly protein PilM [Planctomycetota bacterium]